MCSRAPANAPDPGAESADPEVGGGAGADTGPQTPVPTPTVTREGSPRLDGTATMALPPPATAEPPTGETTDDGPQTTATPAVTASAQPPTIDPTAPTVPPPTAEPPTPPATRDSPPATPTPTPGGELTHVVQAGENLYRIGLLYGLSWVAIAEYNGITDPNTITVGQELRIPPSPTATRRKRGFYTDHRPPTAVRGSSFRWPGVRERSLFPRTCPLAPGTFSGGGQRSAVGGRRSRGRRRHALRHQPAVRRRLGASGRGQRPGHAQPALPRPTAEDPARRARPNAGVQPPRPQRRDAVEPGASSMGCRPTSWPRPMVCPRRIPSTLGRCWSFRVTRSEYRGTS
jgi:LysM repeat protein